MIPGLALLWVAGLGDAAPNLPRLRLSFQELQAQHGIRTFRLERTCCYEALLVDEERGRLFVGAENHVASLSLDNISKRAKKLAWPAPVEWREECNWAGKDIGTECMNFVKLLHAYNHTHLLACGTGAFHPTCAFVEVGHRLEEPMLRLDLRKLEDGKGKSPYDPRHRAASVLGKSCIPGWRRTLWAGTLPSFEAWVRIRVSEQSPMIPAGSMNPSLSRSFGSQRARTLMTIKSISSSVSPQWKRHQQWGA